MRLPSRPSVYGPEDLAGLRHAVLTVLMSSAGQGPVGPMLAPDSGDVEPPDEAEQHRIVALVDLARKGDVEAFGQLYDHYVDSIHRYLYFRLSSVSLADDLTSETFFRALRGIGSFRWQGKDFGAWLTTIARNLVTDHYKSSRSRLEIVADELPERPADTKGPEEGAMAALTSEVLVEALHRLAPEQQDCLVMRFCQGLTIAETARSLGRSEGAVKQLQLRAVRNLAKHLPEDLR
ncbi:MAG TPA: sigma-70 family RNA polymerase sigma factor [Nocardioidaceae bacterium]|nr:sigma-70 family RNA polymerase sigma factor [Nocardioidaceae bacterium]